MKKYVFTVLTIGFMIVMFWFSAQPAKESAALSGSVGEVICRMFVPGFGELSEEEQKIMTERIDFPIRKTAHASEYAVLGILWMITLREYGLRGRKQVLAGAGCAILYAASDEFHQLFVPGRSGQISDVAIDSMGVICGIAIYIILRKLFRIYSERNDLKIRSAERC